MNHGFLRLVAIFAYKHPLFKATSALMVRLFTSMLQSFLPVLVIGLTKVCEYSLK